MKISIISSIHSFHDGHPNFDYKKLNDLVSLYNPDYLGVEIREVDIGEDREYLLRNYPTEMVDLSTKYMDKVFGFDWLGNELIENKIPTDYWNNSAPRLLMDELEADERIMSMIPDRLRILNKKQIQFIKTTSIEELHNGEYDDLCLEVDSLQEKWLKGTRYYDLVQLNELRDKKIAENIIKFIKQHLEATIVVVTGADHRGKIIRNIGNYFTDDISILPVPL